MKIPKSYYFRFWMKNSVMAITTGFVAGLMLMGVIPFLFPVLIIPIFALLIYQYAVNRYFWGKYRGHFEYTYLEWLLRKPINSYVIKILGISNYLRLYLDELSDIGSFREKIYKRLQRKEEIIQNHDLMFCLYLRIAESALKELSFSRETEYLRKAIALHPNDLVANYRLGNSLEKMGDGPSAIGAYEAALRDPVVTEKLKDLVLAQITRIETSGPTKKPPMLGFRYMSW